MRPLSPRQTITAAQDGKVDNSSLINRFRLYIQLKGLSLKVGNYLILSSHCVLFHFPLLFQNTGSLESGLQYNFFSDFFY